MTQLEKELQDVSNVAIAGHIHPDGDSVGSCIGLWQYLRDNYPQIKADIWLEQPDNKFSIIEGYEELKQPDGQDRTYDLFISVDCAALDRLGDALPYFQKAKRTFCVDHHVSNHGFADENVILPDASSACEVLCSLMDPEKINKQAACALYMGIAHDTGVFQYSCTAPETMEAAAELLRKGVNGSDIIDKTFYEKTYVQNQILGKALLESMMVLDKKCIFSYVSKRDMEFFDAVPSDLEGIVSQLRYTTGIEVAIFMYETGYQEYKVSLRSKDAVDVSKIAKYFGGGGHVKAAGCTMKGTVHDVVNNLMKEIDIQLKAIGTKE